MATLTFTIDDTIDNKIINAFCDRFGYQATGPDGVANPQTKRQFFKAQVRAYIRDVYRDQKQREAEASVATNIQTVIAAAEAESSTIA